MEPQRLEVILEVLKDDPLSGGLARQLQRKSGRVHVSDRFAAREACYG